MDGRDDDRENDDRENDDRKTGMEILWRVPVLADLINMALRSTSAGPLVFFLLFLPPPLLPPAPALSPSSSLWTECR